MGPAPEVNDRPRRKGNLNPALYRLIAADIVTAVAIGVPLGIYAPRNAFEVATISLLLILVLNTFALLFDAIQSRNEATVHASFVVKKLRSNRRLDRQMREAEHLSQTTEGMVAKMHTIGSDAQNSQRQFIYDECIYRLNWRVNELAQNYHRQELTTSVDRCLPFATKCIRNARSHVYAVSFAAPEFWTAGSTSEYRAANHEFVKTRKLPLERVFVFDSVDILKDEHYLATVIDEQLALKARPNRMTLRFALRSELAGVPVRDMAMFDDSYILYWNPPAPDRPYVTTTLKWHHAALSEGKRMRDDLELHGMEIVDRGSVDRFIQEYS